MMGKKHYILSSKGKEIICIHHNQEWRPLFYLRAEYNWIRKLGELGHKTYILCAGNTLVDKWCANFYKSLGCSIKLNINCASTCETVVFGDILIQIYIPNEIKKGMQKYFSKIKGMEKINQKLLIDNIFEKKTDIKVIINKDAELAEQIKKDTLSHF